MIHDIDNQVKYKIDNFDYISKKLVDMEAIFLGAYLEKTIRYDDDNLNFSSNGLFIRCKSGINNILTLKENSFKDKDNSFVRVKTEIEVDDITKIDYILEKIGLTNKFIMEKYRLYFKYNNIDISIDELPFGLYMEIKGSDNQIKNILKKLNIKSNDIIYETYWDINKRLTQERDIIFNNNHVFKTATYL